MSRAYENFGGFRQCRPKGLERLPREFVFIEEFGCCRSSLAACAYNNSNRLTIVVNFVPAAAAGTDGTFLDIVEAYYTYRLLQMYNLKFIFTHKIVIGFKVYYFGRKSARNEKQYNYY